MSVQSENVTHRRLDSHNLGEPIALGPPLVLALDSPVKLTGGSAELFIRGDFGLQFVAEFESGQTIYPQISEPNQFVLIPLSELTVEASNENEAETSNSYANWQALVFASVDHEPDDDPENSTLAIPADEFNDQFTHHLLAIQEAREERDLERLSLGKRNEPDSIEAMLTAAAKALGVSATATINTSKLEEFSRMPGVVHAFGLRSRILKLGADWMTVEQGPLMLQQRESGEIACAIWNGKHYEHHDGRPIEDEELNGFRSTAYALFEPLSQEINGLWSLSLYVLKGNNAEFRRLAASAGFAALLGTLVPLATGWILSDIAPAGDLGMLIGVGVALVLAAFVDAVLDTVGSVSVSRIQGRTDFRLNAALYDRLLNLPTGFYKNYTAGDLNQRLSNVNEIKSLILATGMSAGLSVVLSVFYFGALLYFNVTMALVSLLLVATYILLIVLARVLQRPYLTRAYALDGELAEQSYEMISAVAKLRTAAAEERALMRWRERYAEERELQQKLDRIGGWFEAISDGWQVVTLLVLFAMAGWLSTLNLPPGFFIAYLAAFGAFQGAFVNLSSQAIEIYAAQPQLDRAMPILTSKPEVISGRADAGELRGDIEMRSVTFSYHEGQAAILDNLSVKIQAGKHYAIVGGSGSGKSTFLRLLLGFETPQSGAIYFDQQDLAQLDATSVRKQTGVVLQSSSLYAGSIIDNIRGSNNASLEDCLRAASLAGLDEDLKQLPMGLHTALTEGGNALSGGQRQRILIARAFVNKPKIMFFDEATSALDNATQASVAAALDALTVTRITIAHRLSTVRHADCICVLKDGRFIEQGSYDELMALDGEFAKLAQRQLIEKQEGG